MTMIERVSIVDGEPGYTQYTNARKNNQIVTVTLDGKPQPTATAADAAKGWVRRAVINIDGDFATDGDEFLYEVVRGDVIIEVGEGAA